MSLALNEPNKIGTALCSNSETTPPPPSMHRHKWKERKKEIIDIGCKTTTGNRLTPDEKFHRVETEVHCYSFKRFNWQLKILPGDLQNAVESL